MICFSTAVFGSCARAVVVLFLSVRLIVYGSKASRIAHLDIEGSARILLVELGQPVVAEHEWVHRNFRCVVFNSSDVDTFSMDSFVLCFSTQPSPDLVDPLHDVVELTP